MKMVHFFTEYTYRIQVSGAAAGEYGDWPKNQRFKEQTGFNTGRTGGQSGTFQRIYIAAGERYDFSFHRDAGGSFAMPGDFSGRIFQQ